MIELKQVTKEFKQGNQTVTALQSTDFTARPGEFVAIVGPSGSGKSTFLTILGALQSATSGEVTLAGRRIDSLSAKQRSRIRFEKLGFILQASSLVPFLKVGEQLVLHSKVVRKSADLQRRDWLLQKFGVEKLINKYPAQLSGGERQRVAIAAALMHEPEVILADEPTAALDTERAMQTAQLLRDLTHELQRITVMVTHDSRLLKYCDRVYEMRDGRLSEQTGY